MLDKIKDLVPDLTLIEWLIIAAIIAIIGLMMLAAVGTVNHRNELEAKWMPICVEDTMKADPTLSQNDATYRCEVKWETEMLKAQFAADKSHTTVVMAP